MNRSKPYFFSFDVPNSNQMTGHFIVVESMFMPRDQFEDSKFTLFPADYDSDKRLRDLVSCARSYYETNIREPLPQAMGRQVTREEIIDGLRAAYAGMLQNDRRNEPDLVRYPDMETILTYIENHGLPAPAKKGK